MIAIAITREDIIVIVVSQNVPKLVVIMVPATCDMNSIMSIAVLTSDHHIGQLLGELNHHGFDHEFREPRKTERQPIA